MSEELLTITEAKKVIKVGHTYIYEKINNGEIKAVKLGKKTLIPRSSLEAFIASLRPYRRTEL